MDCAIKYVIRLNASVHCAFGNIYFNQPSQAEKCKLDETTSTVAKRRRACFANRGQSFQGRVSHLLLAVMLILILYENARQERLRGQETGMLTRCILGNNTWGKLGQCAADVDIVWSAAGTNLKLPSSGTQCCWSGGRTRGGVASAHDQAPVDLVSLSRLPSPGWGDRQTGAVLVHTGRSPHNARRVNHQQVY